MASSDPLVVVDDRRMGEVGRHVRVACLEPSRCFIDVKLHGQSVAVNAAIERLEAIHQFAHALREGDGGD